MKYIIKKNVWVIVWDCLTCQRRWPLVYVLNKFEKKTIFYLLIFFCKSTLLGCFIVRSHTIFNLWHPFLTHSELGINKPIFKGNIYEHVYCIQCFTEVFLIGILVCNIIHWVQSQIQNSQWIHIFFLKHGSCHGLLTMVLADVLFILSLKRNFSYWWTCLFTYRYINTLW